LSGRLSVGGAQRNVDELLIIGEDGSHQGIEEMVASMEVMEVHDGI
jgi:hypothetical protein